MIRFDGTYLDNIAAGVESEAVFAARALAIGIDPAVLLAMQTAGLGTIARLAFAGQYQPGFGR